MITAKTITVETNVMLPVTASFEGELCDHWCEHNRLRYNMINVPWFKCSHFDVDLHKAETEDGLVYALRCHKCIELFGGE